MGEQRHKAAKAPCYPSCQPLPNSTQLHKPPPWRTPNEGLAEITAMDPLPLRTQPEELKQPSFVCTLS